MRESLELLRLVSRSFYLTIRALPRPLREPIGLAYLLARATDTIADTTQAPVELRLAELQRLAASIAGETNWPGLSERILPEHEGEQLLLSQIADCLEALRETRPAIRNEIKTVLSKIVRGQELDMIRFERDRTGVQTAAQLDQYTYLVAGCVGEFWTRLCFQLDGRFSGKDLEQMCSLGVRFGKGLQLVNILRDIPSDLAAGRCYLPSNELLGAGATPSDLSGAEPVFQKWLSMASDHLSGAYQYIAALPAGRLRYACILPWHLGVLTLRQISATPPWAESCRIKVSRAQVRNSCLRALPAAVSGHFLRRLHDQP